jgi:hypothetical protein
VCVCVCVCFHCVVFSLSCAFVCLSLAFFLLWPFFCLLLHALRLVNYLSSDTLVRIDGKILPQFVANLNFRGMSFEWAMRAYLCVQFFVVRGHFLICFARLV